VADAREILVPASPDLITFDIFGTVLDWRTGLEQACRAVGRPLRNGEFDRIVDRQGELEHGEFLTYAEVTRRSLADVVGLPEDVAAAIGASVGRWPLYADSREALRALMRMAPCAAMTNSDRVHGEQMQEQLGFRLSGWLCAEETRLYKPNVEFWHIMARRRGLTPGPRWWHVSAYADYDLAAANSLGITTVFVRRPHARPGGSTHDVSDLAALVAKLQA
jgi:2-haloacid dehalogenase